MLLQLSGIFHMRFEDLAFVCIVISALCICHMQIADAAVVP